MKNNEWHPGSWKEKSINQIPTYKNKEEMEDVIRKIEKYPPLVPIKEINNLKRKLSDVYYGNGFVIQAGDCAESFNSFDRLVLKNNFLLLSDLAKIFHEQTSKPVIRIGRIAGQYAKPRSDNTEIVNGLIFPSYRGDIINGIELNNSQREYDPKRMETAYFIASATMNALRVFDYDYNPPNLDADDILYSSHEALLLPYEQALLKQDDMGKWYCSSAHFLWIGERTRQLDGAHVEFLKKVENPIGLKIGPTITSDDLLRLIDILNPENDAGRLTLISRFGSQQISKLAPLIETIKQEGRKVIWFCDPMHGNTVKIADDVKTRHYSAIASEIEGFLYAHQATGITPSGLHLEATGLNVTECLGGPNALAEADLMTTYLTTCDPRLNHVQAKAIALLTAKWISSSFIKKNTYIP